MKPKQFKEFLKKFLLKNPHRAVFVRGKVGVGKSATIKQVADEMGMELRDVRLSLLDSVDLRGIPVVEGDETRWTRPAFLPAQDYDKPVLLFLDEFSNAPPTIQHAALQLVLDRQIGEYKLPAGCSVVCAGNTMQDGAYVFRLSFALGNRFVHINFEVDNDDWKEWAIQNGINPIVIGFLNFRRELLHSFKNDVDNVAFPTPRSWGFVSELLDMGIENGILYEAIKGAVGEGAGTEFYSFMKIFRDLPNPEKIADGEIHTVPKESSQLYALCSALVSIVKQKTEKISDVIEYSLKLPTEFSVLLVKDLLKAGLKADVMKSANFKKWLEQYKDVIL